MQTPAEEISRSPVDSGSAVDGNGPLNLNNTKTATSNEHVHDIENPEHVEKLSIEPNDATKLHDLGSDRVVAVNPVQRGEGESSFSVAGPGLEHITYSGPIAVSGSTSLRSESSTTSTRSFAFPM